MSADTLLRVLRDQSTLVIRGKLANDITTGSFFYPDIQSWTDVE